MSGSGDDSSNSNQPADPESLTTLKILELADDELDAALQARNLEDTGTVAEKQSRLINYGVARTAEKIARKRKRAEMEQESNDMRADEYETWRRSGSVACDDLTNQVRFVVLFLSLCPRHLSIHSTIDSIVLESSVTLTRPLAPLSIVNRVH